MVMVLGSFVSMPTPARFARIEGAFRRIAADADPAGIHHQARAVAVTLPVTSQTTGTHVASLSIDPFDPTQPAPNNDGLNSNYRYIGEASVYKPGNALWCSDRGHPLICSRR
jgi:hypothetical protein